MIIEQKLKELSDKALIGKVNVDEEQKLSERFNIMSIPTIIVFKEGKEIDKSIGLITKEKLIDIINEYR